MAGGFNSSLLASARWADPAYMAEKYYFKPGDFWLGRNPHNFDQAIGVEPTEHLFMCASTGSGKGRNVIINNIALWPGNVVAYDPKGDLPVVCAPARGEGDKYTKQNAMSQKVIVLDPLHHSKCEKRYRGYYDPLSSLDPNDDGFRRNCRFVAEMLIKVPEDQNHAEWVKMGRDLVKTIIEHVLTTQLYDETPDDRNIFTVLNLLKKGRKDTFNSYVDDLVADGEISEDEAVQKRAKRPDPFIMLFEEIAQNPYSAHLRDDADSFLDEYKNTPKTFTNMRKEAVRGIQWITEDKRFEQALIGTRNGVPQYRESQKFDPRELKQNPEGISVFIVMPSDEMETFAPWVQAVFLGIFAAMRRTPLHPDIKHPTLGILDEFSSLGKQEFIANAFDTIRDEGMRLLVVVQQMGWLFDTYGKRAESFVENTCARLFFGNVGQSAVDYLVKALGETEIIKFVTTKSKQHAKMEGSSTSDATNSQTSVAEGTSETRSFGSASTVNESTSQAEGTSHAENRQRSTTNARNWNWNNSINWSNGKNWGQGNGRTMGRQYGPHIFWEGLEHSTSYGTSLNKNKGGSHSKGGANARGGGGSVSDQSGQGVTDTVNSTTTKQTGSSETTNENTSYQKSRTVTKTTGETHTETENESDTWTEGESVAEQYHKKPLVESHEFRIYLGRVPENEHDHPSYPGLMLAIIGNEQPLLLRRSNYDQDPFFEGLFSEHPKFPMIGYGEQPMLGYEFTPDHVFEVKLPEILKDTGYELDCLVRPYSSFSEGEEIFVLRNPDGEEAVATANRSGRVLAPPKGEDGAIGIKVWDREGAKNLDDKMSGFFLPFEKIEGDIKTAAEKAKAEAENREKERIRKEQEELKRAAKKAQEALEHEARMEWLDLNAACERYAWQTYSRWLCAGVLFPTVCAVFAFFVVAWLDTVLLGYDGDGITLFGTLAAIIAVVLSWGYVGAKYQDIEEEHRQKERELDKKYREVNAKVKHLHFRTPHKRRLTLEFIPEVFGDLWDF